MSRNIDLSIIIPAYNEQQVIGGALRKIADFIARHKKQLGACEVIVVAVGNDKTAEIAGSFIGTFDHMQVVTRNSRVGKGRDVRIGVQAAKGKAVIFMDADLSTPLHHILTALDRLRGDADVVIGARDLAKIHKGFLRRMLSVASNLLIRTVLFPRYRDTQCGFKGFKANVARTLFAKQSVQGWGFDLEVLQYAKEHHYKVEQLPISDWREEREEDFRGERLGGAALTTLKDLTVVRFAAWARSLVRHWKLCAGIGVAVFFALSLSIGLAQSVWFDEAYSITLVQQQYQTLMSLTAVDAHPPLYYLVLKVWTSTWGVNDLSLRLLSVIFASLAVGGGLLLVRRLFGTRAMLVTLPFVVLAPFLLRYGFEIRMYAMAALVCVAATYAMVSALEAKKQKEQTMRWAAYAILVALGMYTLYYTALVWIAHLVWLTWRARRNNSGASFIKQPWVAAYAGSVVLFSPWLLTFYDQLTHSALSGVGERITYDQLVSIVALMFSFKVHWQLDAWAALAILVAIIALVYAVVTAWRVATEQQRQALMLLLLSIGVPMFILMLASMPPLRPMFLERYLSHLIIFAYLLVGASLALTFKVRPAKAVIIGVFVVLLSVQGIFTLQATGNFTFERVMRPYAKQIAQTVGECQPGDLVIAGDPLVYFEMHYYLPKCDMRFFNGTSPIGERGGYAVLHNSPHQYFEGSPITASRVYLVHTSDSGELPFAMPPEYIQTAQQRFEKFYVITLSRE